MKNNFKKWVKAALIRAVRTVAQTAVSLIPIGVTVAAVGWGEVLGTAALAGVVSILTSIAGLPEVQGDSNE